MRILDKLTYNSFEYFENALITGNGFREYDVRWLLGKEVNPNGFLALGKAYGTLVQTRYGEKKVVVGHDFRQYSQDLCRSFTVGLLSSGVHVIDVGLVLTPMVYFAQHLFQVKGAAMVTASHNENGWTGLKLAKGLSSTLEPDDIHEFRNLVFGGDFLSGAGTYEAYDGVPAEYTRDLLRNGKIKRPLKVVVAAGNGTAGRFAPSALRELGCEIVELDCDPDWTFPRHNPNPEDVAFLHSISARTLESGADLGIGIDGDGDRLGVVDDRGREIFSDKLGLLLARWLCPQYPGRSIVIDVKSTGLYYDDSVLKSAGAEIITWKTGHSYIKAKVAESGALAGFEKSGHWFLNQPLGRGYDDALLSSVYLLRFLSQAGAPLSQLLEALPRTWQSPTLGVFCPDDLKYQVVEEIAAQYEADWRASRPVAGQRIKQLITVNGIRFVLEDDSWGLVRASSNKPSLVVVAESRGSRDSLLAIAADIQRRLAATGKVGDYDQQIDPVSIEPPK